MADLTIGPPSLETDRRGQVLLVTGFALAVTFVGLALVFNSVIYTENLATRSESTTTTDPLVHKQSVASGTATLIEYVNEYNGTTADDYDDLKDNFTWAFDNVTILMVNHQLNDGQVVEDSIVTQYRGTLIQQTNDTRNFTNANNATKWTPVNDSSNGVRSMSFNITEIHTTGEEFNVTAEDSSGNRWEMRLLDTGDGVEVTDPSGSTTSCTDSSISVPFKINVSGGTVGPANCPELAFTGLGTVQKIQFNNSQNANGSYQLVVNKTWDDPSIAVSDPVDEENVDFGPTERFPVDNPAIYGARVKIEYESDVLQYVSEFQVIPGETHD